MMTLYQKHFLIVTFILIIINLFAIIDHMVNPDDEDEDDF